MSRKIPLDWIFTEEQLKDTPSRRNGMSGLEEMKMRRAGVKLIQETGLQLNLKIHPTNGTACVYFQRFYMLHSFEAFPYQLTALSCLFLAGKSEETPKKCKDIAAMAQKENPQLFADYKNLIDDIMGMERVLLQTVRFDLQVEHPYKYLMDYANKMKLTYPQNTIAMLVRCTWTLVNDSYATLLCLSWEPQIVAVALFYLAIKIKGEDKINDTKWWQEYVAELSVEKMESICHAVLDYYSAHDMPKAGSASNSAHDMPKAGSASTGKLGAV